MNIQILDYANCGFALPLFAIFWDLMHWLKILLEALTMNAENSVQCVEYV